MILTCPECATSYFVDDSRIAPAGRTVKCSNCGARWTARLDDPQTDEGEAPEPPAPAAPIAVAAEPRRTGGRSPAPAIVTPIVAPKPSAPEREAKGKVLVWAASAAIVAALIAGAIVFRAQVVQLLPASQAAYAGLGMPVSALVIEKVHAEPAFQGGRPVLSVTGQIRNTRDAAATVPSLRVSLLDRKGKPMAVKVARPVDAQARPTPSATSPSPSSIRPQASTTWRSPSRPPARKPPRRRPPPRRSSARPSRPTPNRCPPAARTPCLPMTDATPVVLLAEDEVTARVEALAQAIAPQVDDETVAVCLLTGGLWFCADLTRALSRLGRNIRFDALWLASYGDARASLGRCEVRADLQRPLAGRTALVVDDVFDTGLSLSEAARLVRDAGAGRVLTSVFARKPWPTKRAIEPDFVAWEAPARFLVGYGMDAAGAYRGLPYIGALD